MNFKITSIFFCNGEQTGLLSFFRRFTVNAFLLKYVPFDNMLMGFYSHDNLYNYHKYKFYSAIHWFPLDK